MERRMFQAILLALSDLKIAGSCGELRLIVSLFDRKFLFTSMIGSISKENFTMTLLPLAPTSSSNRCDSPLAEQLSPKLSK